MCSITHNTSFWNNIEKYVDDVLPDIIKDILAMTGFESEICVKNITAEDISNIEKHIDKEKKLWAKKYPQIYGPYKEGSIFKLLPGHSKFIIAFSERLRKKIDVDCENERDKVSS